MARLAQWLERRTSNPKVPGSNPAEVSQPEQRELLDMSMPLAQFGKQMFLDAAPEGTDTQKWIRRLGLGL